MADFNSDHTADLAEYNTSFQVGGLFIVLAASALGVVAPIILYYCGIQSSPATQLTLLTFKAIGTGIIIATGFIHMLGDAADQLSRDETPELPPVFDYDSWNYVFALATIVACALGDFIVERVRAGKRGEVTTAFPAVADGTTFGSLGGCGHHHMDEEHTHNNPSAAPVSSSSSNDGDKNNKLEEGACTPDNGQLLENAQSRVFTLEAGILIHSVIIGLDLGLQSGEQYIALLSAIVFHQFFEGFALSQLLIEARFDTITPVIWATCFYAVTTPIGIAAGIGARQTFDEDSVASKLTMGILDSISGGILIYIGLMTLMAAWILNNKYLVRAHWTGPTCAFGGLCIGLFIMAFIGIWA